MNFTKKTLFNYLFYCCVSLFFLGFSQDALACDGMSLTVNGTVDNADGTWTYYITACIEPDNGTGAPDAFILSFQGATGIDSYSPASINVPGTTWNGSITATNAVTWGNGGLNTADATFCEDFVVTVNASGIAPTVDLSDGNACGSQYTPPQPCHTLGTPSFTDLTTNSPYDCQDNTNYSITALDAAGGTYFTNGISISIDLDNWADDEGKLVITGSDGSVISWTFDGSGTNDQGKLPNGGTFTHTITNVANGVVYTIDWHDSYGDGSFDYTIIDNGLGKTYAGTWNHSGDFGQNDYQVVLDALIGTSTFSGAGITDNGGGSADFNPNGLSAGNYTITYTYDNGQGCSVTTTQTVTVNCATPCDPTWEATSLCEADGVVDLTSLVTGDPGGTWSGSGVSGTNFDPTGLSGNITVTYDLGACSEDHDFSVDASPDPTWTTNTYCETQGTVNLTSLVAGDAGGTWSGTGVTGTNFDPSGQSGALSVTYTVINGLCTETSTQNITVDAAPDPAWSPTTLCASEAALDLTSLVTGDAGGTWSGTGVTGTNFDLAGQNGTISVTYSVTNGTCTETQTEDMTVTQNADASWTTTALCAGDAAIDLNTLITGNTGGTWSGTGVTGTNFDPTGQSGAISVTYTVGSGTCQDVSTQDITVNDVLDASWTPTTLCADEPAIDLNTLITGDQGGTWSGTGVTGSTFDPSGQDGNIAVTYTIGTGGCQDIVTDNMAVTALADPAWTPQAICAEAGTIDLSLWVSGNPGGTWTGTGVTGSDFDPTGLEGDININYEVGTGSCLQASAQNVHVDTTIFARVKDTTVCETAGNVVLEDLNLISTSTSWSGNNITNTYFDPIGMVGANEVFFTIENGVCSDEATSTITVTAAPSADWTMPYESISNEVGSIDLTSSLSTGTERNGVWSGEGMDEDGNFDPTGLEGKYEVTYTVGDATCGNEITRSIYVFAEFTIDFYNAFTPNGDDVNDNFKPLGTYKRAEAYELKIYNRWGEKVFETNNPEEAWNGNKYNNAGRPSDMGEYVYTVNLENYEGVKEKYQGTLMLFR